MTELRVIETLAWNGTHLVRFERHLARLAGTCTELGFTFAESAVLSAFGDVSGPHQRVRLTLAKNGQTQVKTSPMTSTPEFWQIAIAQQPLDSKDPWLRFKTTNRDLYDQTRAGLPSGIDEAIFLNERGEVCEGTITNIFADLGSGLVTPPVRCGLLPGILRQEMLETGACSEAVLALADIRQAHRLFVGNSLRGLIAARLA